MMIIYDIVAILTLAGLKQSFNDKQILFTNLMVVCVGLGEYTNRI